MPLSLAVPLLLCIGGIGCSHADEHSQQANPAQTALSFDVIWTEATATPEEAQAVSAVVENALTDLRALLGPAQIPKRKLVVRLLGDAINGAVPSVDPSTGDVLLVRYPGDAGGYTASVVHEMVHAIRWDLWTDDKRQTDAFLFIEEGFAEAAAIQVSRPSQGFPTFGFPVALAAGAWLGDNAAADLVQLIRRHKTLNFQCMAQAYSLRLSFVAFLVERNGFERLLQLAYASDPIEPSTIGEHYETTLEALTEEWATWAHRQRDAVSGVVDLTAAYRESPIKYLPHCDEIADLKPEPGE